MKNRTANRSEATFITSSLFGLQIDKHGVFLHLQVPFLSYLGCFSYI